MLRYCIKENLFDGIDALIEAALDQGGKDNITAILVEPEEVLKAEVVAARAKAMENLFLFQELPFHARLRVGRIVSEINVKEGERIVEQGSVGNTLFVVVQGTFSVQLNGDQVAVLKAGEHFGELALVDSEPRSADIIALEASQLLAIDRDTLQDYCVMEPALGNLMLWKLVATLGMRLRATNQVLSDR
jgi:CRP-like cAMP-binding protein